MPNSCHKSFKDDGRTDLLCRGPDIGVATCGKNKKSLFGKPREGADDGLDVSTLPKPIHTADGGDNPLGNLLSHPTVLDELEVFILA